jgi:hypothetical protein
MANKRTGFSIIPGVAFPVSVPVRPIGKTEMALVQSVLAEVASEWTVELENGDAEDAILVVLPEGGDDATGPSYVISRDSCGLRLDQVHWDQLTEIGVYDSFVEILTTLRPLLAFCASYAVPATVTLH